MRPWDQRLLSGVSLSHRRCRISPRRYRPSSRRRRRSAIAAGCSGCFCTGTGRCRTSPRSRSVQNNKRTVCVSASRGRRFAAQGKKEARYLVRSVGAVVVSITLPAAGNATAVGAGELALRTLARHWGAHGESQGDGRSGGASMEGGGREEARRGVKEEKRKQGAEQTANI